MSLLDQFGNAADKLFVFGKTRLTRDGKRLAGLQEQTEALWTGFDAEMRTPEPSWQQELDAICPRRPGMSWLLIRWYPGYPWAPAHRWVIYQCTAKEQTPDLVLMHLEGADPRKLGFWDPIKQEYRSVARVSRYQWDIYRELGCYAASYWIIQGSHGGHKAKFNHVESALSHMNGGPRQPPDPGQLPYAPFDQRVIAKLLQFKRWAELERDEEEAKRKMRAMLWEWMSTQIMEELDGKDALLRKAFRPGENIPRVRDSQVRREEAARESFINEG